MRSQDSVLTGGLSAKKAESYYSKSMRDQRNRLEVSAACLKGLGRLDNF